ncbi:hypothetical protein P5V15_009417 [Pogonomyrmex californicus]
MWWERDVDVCLERHIKILVTIAANYSPTSSTGSVSVKDVCGWCYPTISHPRRQDDREVSLGLAPLMLRSIEKIGTDINLASSIGNRPAICQFWKSDT